MWNYRCFKYKNDTEGLIYISEVYYDNLGRISSWVDPVDMKNFMYGNSKEEISSTLEHIKQALIKPILVISGSLIIREECD